MLPEVVSENLPGDSGARTYSQQQLDAAAGHGTSQPRRVENPRSEPPPRDARGSKGRALPSLRAARRAFIYIAREHPIRVIETTCLRGDVAARLSARVGGARASALVAGGDAF
jgi:hypothetical protein